MISQGGSQKHTNHDSTPTLDQHASRRLIPRPMPNYCDTGPLNVTPERTSSGSYFTSLRIIPGRMANYSDISQKASAANYNSLQNQNHTYKNIPSPRGSSDLHDGFLDRSRRRSCKAASDDLSDSAANRPHDESYGKVQPPIAQGECVAE
jgi:hypothetical protein